MNQFFNLCVGLLSIIGGYQIIKDKKFFMHGGEVDFTSPFLHIPIGLFFILFGLYLIYRVFKPYKKKSENDC